MWCVRPAYVCAHKSLGFRRHCRCCRTLSITEEKKNNDFGDHLLASLHVLFEIVLLYFSFQCCFSLC